MTTRLAISVFVGLLSAPVGLLVAQEHPRPPQQSQSQQLPQTTRAAPQAATMEASQADISAGLKKYIDSSARKSPDKKFHMRYRGKDLPLELVKIHDDRLSSLGGDKYFACVDMRAGDGKIYDIDFSMAIGARSLKITETSVHKINGKSLYNWKEEGGVWKRVRVS